MYMYVYIYIYMYIYIYIYIYIYCLGFGVGSFWFLEQSYKVLCTTSKVYTEGSSFVILGSGLPVLPYSESSSMYDYLLLAYNSGC